MNDRKFAVFDIDGTLIRWQLFHSIVDSLAKSGQIDKTTDDKVKAARMNWKHRTHTDSYKEYEAALVSAFENAVTAISVKQFDAVIATVFEEYKDQVYIFTRDLITKLKSEGYTILAVSGSHDEIVSKMAEYYGFDDFVGSKYVREGDRFTGEGFIAAMYKQELLKDLISKHDLSLGGSVAVGDSEGDIPMLEMVERPIAFNPSKGLFAHASDKGWQIVVERKNVIYELNQKDGKYYLA